MERIPEVVVRRLPIYARALSSIASEGVGVMSSLELGRRLGVTPAQIRKDLSYFGEFGKQGTGYDVAYLLGTVRSILGLEHEWPMALIGVGRLGRAIASYPGFQTQGFRIVALFDDDPNKVGSMVDGMIVSSMSELHRVVERCQIAIAIVAVPAAAGQDVIDRLVECGVSAILNYAPVSVTVPPHVRLRDVDPVVALQSMTYYLKHPSDGLGTDATSPRAGKSRRDYSSGL